MLVICLALAGEYLQPSRWRSFVEQRLDALHHALRILALTTTNPRRSWFPLSYLDRICRHHIQCREDLSACIELVRSTTTAILIDPMCECDQTDFSARLCYAKLPPMHHAIYSCPVLIFILYRQPLQPKHKLYPEKLEWYLAIQTSHRIVPNAEPQVNNPTPD